MMTQSTPSTPDLAAVEDAFVEVIRKHGNSVRGTDEQFAEHMGCTVEAFAKVRDGLVEDGLVVVLPSLFEKGVPVYGMKK